MGSDASVATAALGAGANVAAAGVAQGVMPDQVLGGPVWWFIMGVYLLAIGLSIYCLVDSLRPARQVRLAELPEPAPLYTVFFVVYVFCVLGVWVPAVPRPISVVPVLLTPFALALGVAYLLRVVFPKPSAPDVTNAEVSEVLGEDSHPSRSSR